MTPYLPVISLLFEVKFIQSQTVDHSFTIFFKPTIWGLASTVWVLWWQRSSQGWGLNGLKCSRPAVVSCSHAPSAFRTYWWQHPEGTLCSAWSHLTPDQTGPLAKPHQTLWRAPPLKRRWKYKKKNLNLHHCYKVTLLLSLFSLFFKASCTKHVTPRPLF